MAKIDIHQVAKMIIGQSMKVASGATLAGLASTSGTLDGLARRHRGRGHGKDHDNRDHDNRDHDNQHGRDHGNHNRHNAGKERDDADNDAGGDNFQSGDDSGGVELLRKLGIKHADGIHHRDDFDNPFLS